MNKPKSSSNKKKKWPSCNGGAECERLGYCVRARQSEIIEQRERDKKYRMDELFIGNLVPLRVEKNTQFHLGDYSKRHLQIACDAFHQQDFESASLHSKAVIQANTDCSTAYICVVAAEYFLCNYEEATYYAVSAESHCYSPYQQLVLERFNLHCQNLIREKLKTTTKTESGKVEATIANFMEPCDRY
jgi:hypothetical protein